MECNRDEASRAKEIAERKFLARDAAGAKKFALKAHNLYPELEGLPQMLSTLDVHLAAENKISGEADWYGILGVNPLADDETVKKQYRKLALMLHPDKNKSVGADGAFKLISEAWSLLSDKTKRTAYDQKRFLKTFHQKTSPSSGGPSAPSGANGFQNFTTNMSSKASVQKNSRGSSSTASRHSKPRTFWTACHRCKMQYEYLRMYLNHNLLCPNCHEPFMAVQIPAPPSKGSNSSNHWSFSQQHQNSKNHAIDKNAGAAGFTGFNQTSFQWGPFSRTSGVGSATASPSTAAQAASVVQQAYERVKREREEKAAARRREALLKKNNVSKRAAGNSPAGISNTASRYDLKGDRPVKRRNVDDDARNGYAGNATNRMPMADGGPNFASGLKQFSLDKDRANFSSVANNPNSIRELTQLEIRNMLAEKARMEIRKKLKEWSLATGTRGAGKGKDKETDDKEKEKTAESNGNSITQIKSTKPTDAKERSPGKEAPLGASHVDLSTEARESMSISVPDPDFHDFDRDRSERCFGENQVWAAYDDDNGMPRYYAMIHNVISLNPFKMQISWLNSKTNSELGPLNWVSSGFSKTCGDFRVGRYEINDSLNSFSHKVRWTKGSRGAVQIFPRKGDVWAIYRNWSPDWNELTPDEVIHKYDMVEVLEDYSEEQGVYVTPLVKVAGFKTVFHRHLDPSQIRRIPREEMFQFSHQVPSYLLTGSEAQNAPKGCRELDPAATPMELLQVITDVKEEEMENAEAQCMDEVKDVEILGNAKEQSKKEEGKVGNADEQSSRKGNEGGERCRTDGKWNAGFVKV